MGVGEHCEKREKARVRIEKNVAEGDDEAAGGRNEYLLSRILDTLATFHLLTSLLNMRAVWNTARREKARVRMGKNVADGDDETAGEEMNTYCSPW